ncbi:MAG: sugar ABC transporter permease, partial [Ruminococcus sp.]|nr:sugar ABC transporter permease [Ruminococcus sp.]
HSKVTESQKVGWSQGPIQAIATFPLHQRSNQPLAAASVVVVWQALFHDKGFVNSVLETLHLESVPWLSSGYGMTVLVLIFVWKTMGYNMVLMMAGLSGIPVDYLEMAKQEGASAWWQFLHIKLRYLFPTLFFILLYDIICSFKVFREVYLLTGDYPCEELYLLQHFMNNTFESANYQKLSAAAILLALVMLITVGILFFIEQKKGKELEE